MPAKFLLPVTVRVTGMAVKGASATTAVALAAAAAPQSSWMLTLTE